MLARARQKIEEAKRAEMEEELTPDRAAIRIQSIVRMKQGKGKVKARAQKTWQRIYDPKFKIYFWYNRLNGQSQWTVPKYVQLFVNEDIKAVKTIQRYVRGFVGKMRVRKLIHRKYTRFYDSNLNRFYWMENSTKRTFWKASKWLTKQEIPLPPEDDMILKAQQKIRELEEKLKQKEQEIVEVRKKRYEELEPEVLQDRVVNAKSLQRTKNMDEWSIDQLAAWFTELKMDEYIPFIYSNRFLPPT